jgi:hypothetical protein
MTAFIYGLFIGAIGMIVLAYFVWRNNKKKFMAALTAAIEGPGTPQEKVKKILDIIKG